MCSVDRLIPTRSLVAHKLLFWEVFLSRGSHGSAEILQELVNNLGVFCASFCGRSIEFTKSGMQGLGVSFLDLLNHEFFPVEISLLGLLGTWSGVRMGTFISTYTGRWSEVLLGSASAT